MQGQVQGFDLNFDSAIAADLQSHRPELRRAAYSTCQLLRRCIPRAKLRRVSCAFFRRRARPLFLRTQLPEGAAYGIAIFQTESRRH